MSTAAAAQHHTVGSDGELYRHDGVRITHDPFSSGMAAKYGAPGATDREGFDPYADSVGAGIYSGTVVRDRHGAITIGQQYQNHNANPGPVYSGGGYTPISMAIAKYHKEEAAYRASTKPAAAAANMPENATTLGRLLELHPDLVNDVSTGGALPLHTCGMSRENQHATAFLIEHGADIEAVDTYGFTPLHRMASNNLAVGAAALLDAGADPKGLKGSGVVATKGTPSPMEVAMSGRARDVVTILQHQEHAVRNNDEKTWIKSVDVFDAGYAAVVGRYVLGGAKETIPAGFAAVCVENGWPTKETWEQLNGGDGDGRWFKHADASNDSYMYYNNSDKCWWIDGPDGLGAYKAPGPSWAIPAGTTWWKNLKGDESKFGPTLAVNRN